MNVDLGIWEKLSRLVIFLLFIAGLLILAIWYLPLIRSNEKWRRLNFQKEAQIQKELETNHQLTAALDALHKDPKASERLARETLGYSKSGEIVIRFESPATNSPPRQ
jgi:cell division protein FtsB